MDDSAGAAARETLEWGAKLARESSLSVTYIDERLSSFAAEELLARRKQSGGKMTRKMKKARLDAHAAAIFLQAFLDGRLAPLDASKLQSTR